MIDFHCHLDLYSDPRAVVDECKRREIVVLSVTTTPSAWEVTSSLGAGSSRILSALGLHPQLAGERKSEVRLFESLLPRTDFVGEIGLDGSPEFRATWTDQVEVFSRILALCSKGGGKVLSIHSRRASSAVLQHLSNHEKSGIPVLHWFSGSLRDLNLAIELGCWFSVNPVMVDGQRGQDLFSRMPRDRVLTESDGPFARRNELPLMPWDVCSASESIASIWNESTSTVDSILDENLQHLLSQLARSPDNVPV